MPLHFYVKFKGTKIYHYVITLLMFHEIHKLFCRLVTSHVVDFHEVWEKSVVPSNG